MANHPLWVNAGDVTGLTGSALLNAMMKRETFTLDDGEDLVDFEFNVGEIPLTIYSVENRSTYFYDEADGSTDASIDCLVSGDGKRYKGPVASAINFTSVIDVLNDPPADPELHDQYIIDTVPTGVWADYADCTTIYTPLGWRCALPYVGSSTFNEATNSRLEFNNSGLWGAPSYDVAAGSLDLYKLKHAMGLSVEAVSDAPPGSPAEGIYYIVGLSPSGDFTGQSNDIAYYISGSWVFLEPTEGDRVYDKDGNVALTYGGSTWAESDPAFVRGLVERIAIDYDLSATTSGTDIDIDSFVFSGVSGQKLRFKFQFEAGDDVSYLYYFAKISTSQANLDSSELELAIYRDAETTPIKTFAIIDGLQSAGGRYVYFFFSPEWRQRYENNSSEIDFSAHPDDVTRSASEVNFGDIDISDGSSHTYYLRLVKSTTGSGDAVTARIIGNLIVELLAG